MRSAAQRPAPGCTSGFPGLTVAQHHAQADLDQPLGQLGFAFALAAARPLLAGQPVGGRWFGGVGGVLFPPRQLPLQIRDLFFGVRNLLFAFGNLPFAFAYLTAQFFVLSQQPLIFPVQLFPAGLVGVPIAIRHRPWSPYPPSPSRTHPG